MEKTTRYMIEASVMKGLIALEERRPLGYCNVNGENNPLLTTCITFVPNKKFKRIQNLSAAFKRNHKTFPRDFSIVRKKN